MLKEDHAQNLQELGRSKTIKISLIRHGEAEHNLAKPAFFAGRSKEFNSHLTAKGEASAEEIASEIKKKGKVDTIIHSSLNRSRETALTIANELGYPLDIIELSNIDEVDFGSLSGKSREEIFQRGSAEEKEALNVHINEDVTKISYPGGETFDEVRRRVIDSLEFILTDQESKKHLVVVGHGNLNRIILTLLSPEDKEFVSALFEKFPHTAILDFDLTVNKNGKIKLHNIRLH